MNHYKSLVLYCCLGVQFAVDAVVIRREYYRPYPDDPAGAKMKSLRSIMYIVNLVCWMGIAVAWFAREASCLLGSPCNRNNYGCAFISAEERQPGRDG